MEKLIIETDRTLLRPIEFKDREEIFSYRSDSETNKYQGFIPQNIEDLNKFISEYPKDFNIPETWFQLAIVEKSTNRIIGDLGIHFIDQENFQCEFGCTLNKNYHGKGFATETMYEVINYVFKKLNKHRIVASLDPQNIGSIKLVERLGFRKEGHFKESLLINGKWVDDIIYAILSTEWKENIKNLNEYKNNFY